MHDETPKPPFTLTGCLWRIGLGLFVLAIVLGGGSFNVSREYHRHRAALQAEVQRIRNLGEPLGSAELVAFAAMPVGETDITQQYVKALQPLLGEKFDRLKTAADKTADGIDLDAIPLRPSPWPELESIEAYLAPYASALDELTAASKLSGSVRYPADFSLGAALVYDMPEIVHRACDLLFLRSACQYHRSDFEAATESILAIIRLGDTLRLDPTFLSQLIRQSAYEMAMSTLVHLSTDPEFPAESIARIQEGLETERFDRAFYRAAIGERSFAFDAIQSPASELLEGGVRTSRGKATVAEARPGDSAMLLRLRSLHVETGKLPWDQAIAANEAARQATDAEKVANAKRFSWNQNHVTELADASVSSFFNTMLRCECERRAAVTICAIERYRRERGQLPDALPALVPDYLAELPLDPVNQKPMTYASTGSAYKVYSIGADQRDDGGRLGNSRGAEDYGWQVPRARQVTAVSP